MKKVVPARAAGSRCSVSLGTSVSDDPTTRDNTGIAKPLDVPCLQEVNAPNTTCAQYALLNSMYGTTSFSSGTLAGAGSGAAAQFAYTASRLAPPHLTSSIDRQGCERGRKRG